MTRAEKPLSRVDLNLKLAQAQLRSPPPKIRKRRRPSLPRTRPLQHYCYPGPAANRSDHTRTPQPCRGTRSARIALSPTQIGGNLRGAGEKNVRGRGSTTGRITPGSVAGRQARRRKQRRDVQAAFWEPWRPRRKSLRQQAAVPGGGTSARSRAVRVPRYRQASRRRWRVAGHDGGRCGLRTRGDVGRGERRAHLQRFLLASVA